MILRKIVVIIILLIFSFEQASLAVSLAEIVDAKTKVKFGQLLEDETWEGRIFLIGDVTVPLGKTLTIKPGTILIFDERDALESGKFKDQCEIIAYGNVNAAASADNPIQMVSVLGFDSNKIVELDPEVRVIRFSPYTIDTEPLKKEFRDFKHEYFLVWGIIYGMWIFARNI